MKRIGCTPKNPLCPLTAAIRAADGAAPADARQAADSAPRLRAGDLLHAALTLPEDAKIAGRSVTLVEVLSAVVDRGAQREATEAYWKLAAALAEYNFCRDELDQLLRLSPATTKDATDAAAQTAQWLAPRMADAKARWHEAESSLVAAQYVLGERMRLAAGQPPPLPADPPHIGPYRTRLTEIYSGRVPPPRTVLIDRTLPLRHESIDLRAAAAQAALDAVDSLEEAYHRGEADLPAVLAAVDHLARQRRAFIVAVRQYNDNIAEYALALPYGGLTSQGLASMLVKPRAESPSQVMPAGGAGATPGGVERAGYDQPLGSPRQPAGSPTVAPPLRRGEPTLAPPRNHEETTPAKGKSGSTPASPPGDDKNDPAAQAPDPKTPTEKSRTANKPDAAGDPAAGGATDKASSAGDGATPGAAKAGASGTSGDAAALGADLTQPGAAVAPQGLYPALTGLSPARQAQHLAEVLHWDRELPSPQGTPVTLRECLASAPPAQRRAVIEAYWSVREQTARYHALGQAIEQLDEIAPLLLSSSEKPGAADAMVWLLSARRAAAADAAEARIAALERQFALTELARRPVSQSWLLPSTPPHAGGYRMKLDAQSQAVRESTVVRRAATSIPLVQEALAERATGVVAADTASAAAIAQVQSGRPAVPEALRAIAEQLDQTLAFLATLSDYNRQIADYATSVLPPETTAETLAGAGAEGVRKRG